MLADGAGVRGSPVCWAATASSPVLICAVRRVVLWACVQMRLMPRPSGWGLKCSDLLYELCSLVRAGGEKSCARQEEPRAVDVTQ